MKRNYENEGSQLARLIEAIQVPLRYEIECFTTTKAIWEFLDKLFGDDKELIKILMNDIPGCPGIWCPWLWFGLFPTTWFRLLSSI
jgi:hypothetical protein